MSSQDWAYFSNYAIYSAMVLFTLAFFGHAFETAWAVRTPVAASETEGNLVNKTFDSSRTQKAMRIATAMMILGFVFLLLLVVSSK